ncbi:MAG: YlmC/YmxH family sporulation protein [Firmicutes bacterium]|nr:YlmC/YmxH family sporulation protein [Bacillota bacterium]
MDITFLELRSKEVINIIDGKKLGKIIDILFDMKQGRIIGFIVPGERSLNIFRRSEDILVPWKNILRVGEDVILVELFLGGYRGGGPKNQRRLYEGEIEGDDYIKDRMKE